jgi:hypothetical protein
MSMRRTIAIGLLIALLVIGGGVIATAAYQVGLNVAVTTAVAEGGTVVAPVPGYGWGYGPGYGWHPFGFGSGIFGLLFGLFFLFIIFGLIRAIFWGGRRGWGPGGWGGPGGPVGPGNGGASRFEEWHRRAHEGGSSNEPPASNTTSKPA